MTTDIHALFMEAEAAKQSLEQADKNAKRARDEMGAAWIGYLKARIEAARAVGHRAWKHDSAIAEKDKRTRTFCLAFVALAEARAAVNDVTPKYEESQARVLTACREYLGAAPLSQEQPPDQPAVAEALSP
jgi:hypothetical protein